MQCLPASSLFSRTAFRAAGLALAVALPLLAGCNAAGPDQTVAPSYIPKATAKGGNGAPVAVRVTDKRKSILGKREDGREVIASGDKGKVFLAESPVKTLEKNLSIALEKAGYKVDPNAPVIVDAELVQLDVKAEEFTHWGLPSERASTIDGILGALPGPVRPTTAKTFLNVVIRKHDQRWGFAHPVDEEVTNKDRDRAVVDQTVSQSMSAAIDEVVASAAKDIALVAKLPVSAAEIATESTAVTQQKEGVLAITESVRREQAELAAERARLAAVRGELDRDKLNWSTEKQRIETDRRQVTADRLALDKDKAAAAALGKALEAKQKEVDGLLKIAQRNAEQEAQLERLRRELAGEKAVVDQSQTAVAAAEAKVAANAKKLDEEHSSLTLRQQQHDLKMSNVASREQDISAREAAAGKLNNDLHQWQTALDRKESDLREWEVTLKNQATGQISVESLPETIARNAIPNVRIIDPAEPQSTISAPQRTVKCIVSDDQGIANVQFTVNGKVVRPRVDQPALADSTRPDRTRGVFPKRSVVKVMRRDASSTGQTVMESHEFTADLKPGENVIVVEAWDHEGRSAKDSRTVRYDIGEGTTYVVAIGIDKYSNGIPELRYAVADAKLFAATVQKRLDLPPGNVRVLKDSEATIPGIMKLFDKDIRNLATRKDTVVIYFSGHGAPQIDANDQEKYLLPVEAELGSFRSTAIPMKDINNEVFDWLSHCRRIVFVADTCYSGAVAPGSIPAGTKGRSVSAGGAARAVIPKRAVVEQLSGHNHIIMTASSGSELSQEKDALGHGVFTYYLAKGLDGHADRNRDRQVSVAELYDYVKVEVANATNQTQNPVIDPDGEEGKKLADVILSIIK